MKYFYIIVLTFMLFGTVYCQTEDITEYSLNDCISMAIEHNSELKAAQNMIISAKAGTEIALSDYYPKLSANNQTFETKMHNNSNFEKGTSVSANMKLLDTGLRYLTVQSAKKSEKETYCNVFRTYQTVMYQVMTDYFNCQRYSELIALKENSVRYYTQEEKEYNEKIALGEKAPVDIYPIQASLADSKVVLLSAKNLYENSKCDLLNLMGLEETGEYSFLPEPVETKDTEKTKEEIVETALSTRSDLAASEYAISAASADKKKADMDLWPILYINAEFTNDFNNKYIDTDKHSDGRIMGYISWNLFDGFNTQAKIKRSKTVLDNAKENKAKLERDIVTKLKTLWNNITINKEQLEASKIGFESADRNREVQKEKFSLNMNTNLDILNAQMQYDTSMANLINSRYDLKISYIELDYQMGLLGLDDERIISLNKDYINKIVK